MIISFIPTNISSVVICKRLSGGTRNTCDPVDEQELEKGRREEFMDPQKYTQVQGKLYRIDRARMLFLNFFTIRILVTNVLLCPWLHGLCAKPTQKMKKQALRNQRIVASLLYFISRTVDPQLPQITVEEIKDTEKDTKFDNNDVKIGKFTFAVA